MGRTTLPASPAPARIVPRWPLAVRDSRTVDLTPTPAEQEAFRAECRAWLREHLPWEYGVGLPPLFDDLAEEVEFLPASGRRPAGRRPAWSG